MHLYPHSNTSEAKCNHSQKKQQHNKKPKKQHSNPPKTQAKRRVTQIQNPTEATYTQRTDLICAALSGIQVSEEKKKKLFERSEFFFFLPKPEWSSVTNAVLNFCSFWFKPKEKAFQ